MEPVSLNILHFRNQVLEEDTIYIGNTITTFSQHAPFDIAYDLGIKIRDGETDRTRLFKICKDFLLKTHPYYSCLLKQSDDQIESFLSRFIAGACGFYNTYIRSAPIFLYDDADRAINVEMVETLFPGCSDSFLACCVESLAGVSEKTIIQDEYFGNYVYAYRLMEASFHTPGDSIDLDRIKAHVILSGFIKSWNQSISEYCRSPFLHKNSVIYDGMFQEFIANFKRISTPVSESAIKGFHSIYECIEYELSCIAFFHRTLKVKVSRCKYCYRYFVTDKQKGAKYCFDKCEKNDSFWDKRIRSSCNNNHSDSDTKLNPFFCHDLLISRCHEISLHGFIDYDAYMAFIISVYKTKINKEYYFHNHLIAFTSGIECTERGDLLQHLNLFLKSLERASTQPESQPWKIVFRDAKSLYEFKKNFDRHNLKHLM